MIDIKYGQLFSVELLHKYTGNQLCNDFTIVPSLRTQHILNNHRIVVKQYDNVLYAGVDLDPEPLKLTPPLYKPFIVPEEGLQLTFFLLLNNPLFFNYTSIQAANNNGNVYYFSNRNNNISNGKKFLTGGLPGFVSGTYSYEDIVVDTGITFQSVSENNSANLNSTNWRQLGSDRFMSGADLLSWVPPVSQFALNPATPVIDVEVTGYDGSGNYTQPVFTTTINNPGNLPSFRLDLSSLEIGKYLLSINGTTPPKPIYLNNELSNIRIFGVIDLFVESTMPDAYKILNANNELQSPLYSIYFLNRATIWKYILTSTNSSAIITDSANLYHFAQPTTPTSPTTILSQFPIPLSETPLTLKLDGQDIPRPPCAGAERLNKVNPGPGTVYYSEIFLNY